MASLYPKKINGKTYWYLREMARVDGKAKMVSERYLGTAADIAAAVEGGEAAMMPERTRHLAFGDVAAVWEVMTRLDVIAVVDEVTGGKVRGAGASTGTYLALAALNRVVDPRSRLASPRGGKPRPPTGSPRSPLGRWITAGSGMRCTRSPSTSLPRSSGGSPRR